MSLTEAEPTPISKRPMKSSRPANESDDRPRPPNPAYQALEAKRSAIDKRIEELKARMVRHSRLCTTLINHTF